MVVHVFLSAVVFFLELVHEPTLCAICLYYTQTQLIDDTDFLVRDHVGLKAEKEEKAAHYMEIDQEEQEVETAAGLSFSGFLEA